MYKGIIFDLDGVLLDSEQVNIKAAEQAYKEFGYHILGPMHNMIVGRHPMDYGPKLAKKFGIDLVTQKHILKTQAERYRRLWEEQARLMPNTKDTLALLKERSFTLALVTSSGRSRARTFLSKFSFTDYFKVVIAAEDVTKRKPHPQPYILAVERLKIRPLLVVEDTEIGVVAAKEAGLDCMAVPNQYTRGQDFSLADYRKESLSDIFSLL